MLEGGQLSQLEFWFYTQNICNIFSLSRKIVNAINLFIFEIGKIKHCIRSPIIYLCIFS